MKFKNKIKGLKFVLLSSVNTKKTQSNITQLKKKFKSFLLYPGTFYTVVYGHLLYRSLVHYHVPTVQQDTDAISSELYIIHNLYTFLLNKLYIYINYFE